MARKVVGDVAVRVGADVGPLKIGLQEAGQSVNRFGNRVRRSSVDIARNVTRIGLAATAMGTAVVAASAKAVSALDGIGKKARQVGITAESLQELQFGATSAGVSLAGLDSSLERLAKRLGEAQQGFGAAKRQLEEFNLEADDLIEMGLDGALDVIADKIAALESPAQRAAAAAALFGREGVAMINMMENGSRSLDEFRQRAREAGAVIDNDLIQAAEDLEDQIGTTSLALRRQFQATLVELGPILIGIMETANDFAGALRSVADAIRSINEAAQPLLREFNNVQQGSAELDPGQFARDQEGFDANAGGDRSTTGTLLDPNDPFFLEGLGGVGATAGDVNRIIGGGSFAPGRSVRPPSRDLRTNIDNIPGFDDRGGGGGGSNPFMPTEREFELMRERFQTRRDIAQEEFDKDMERLRAMREAGIATEEEYNQLEENLTQEHADKIRAIDQAARAQRLSDLQGMFGDLASLMSSENSKLFNIGKAAAIAEAVVSGYTAAVEAWEKGMRIGGPPVAAAFTAASLAKTGGLIMSLKSQSIGGSSGAQVNPGGSGAGVQVGGAPQVQEQGPTRPNISLTLIGERGFTRADIVKITELINDSADEGQTPIQLRGRA